MAIKLKKKEIENNLPYMCNVDGSIRPSNANIMNVFGEEETTPVIVKKVSVLGTTSEYSRSFYEENANHDRLATGNPQNIETAHLEPETNRFCVQGSVNFVPRCMGLTNCHENENRSFDLSAATEEIMLMIKEKGGMRTLARKYAAQLVNGDILFRNKYADDLRAVVGFMEGGWQELEFDCRAQSFGNPEGLESLAGHIEKALTEENRYFHPVYRIYGTINYGGEVYPSQELEMNRPKTLFRNKIQDEPDAAGIHSQKAGNALRKIDTWYSHYNEIKRAIPVDPYGPDKSRAKAIRRPNSGESFYEIFAGLDQLADRLKKQDEPDGDAMFFAAMMVRGGVFSIGKEKSKGSEAA